MDLSSSQREKFLLDRNIPKDVRAEVESLPRFDSAGDVLTPCIAAAALY
jgi:hypothetical protein